VALAVAPGASGTTSGGGSGTYGGARLNDGLTEAQCATTTYCWITATSTPGTAWAQYTWTSAKKVGRIKIDTALPTQTSCSVGTCSRNVAGATVQYWSGSSWVTAGVVSGKSGDWEFTFPTPVTTTQIRLYALHAGNACSWNQNPVIWEWDVFEC
ncbi:MAG TPA: hypothetical protein PKD61_19845, partial [Polyangiaceae bacterium]|nr:hypothetical protein [Polyangiaceae bacterium]